ncbi:Hypothetical_protein [Hexamita inflata]|uniref:Hypothetical_protein n=1 Tax=Hexamita inflata TaxID=28002 RepID=A0AA86QNG5_9EUKA|nr:Hypothetical protein HINF_LOCUS45038 [Hexamita inflata]
MSSSVRLFFCSKPVLSSCKVNFNQVSVRQRASSESVIAFWQQIHSGVQFLVAARCSRSCMKLLSIRTCLRYCSCFTGSMETMQLSRKSMYCSLDSYSIPTRLLILVLLIVNERRFVKEQTCLIEVNCVFLIDSNFFSYLNYCKPSKSVMLQAFNVRYKSYVGALLKLKLVHLFKIKHSTDIWSVNFISFTLVSLMISNLLQLTYDLNLFGNSESYFSIARI